MKIDWSPLDVELAHWRRDGLVLPIWWRDDDAVAATPALERLSDISLETGMPVHVAVIPDLIEHSLGPALLKQPNLVPVIHGWRHHSHAPVGAKKAEFGEPRLGATDELAHAHARMIKEFGASLVQLFVPPWNRIDDSFLPALVSIGYNGISTYGPRSARFASGNLVQINTHIDPIFWRGHRGLVDPDDLVTSITNTLRDRRIGHTDNREPLGLLTHHLVHTDEVWTFSRDILSVLLDGGAVPANIAETLQDGRKPNI